MDSYGAFVFCRVKVELSVHCVCVYVREIERKEEKGFSGQRRQLENVRGDSGKIRGEIRPRCRRR